MTIKPFKNKKERIAFDKELRDMLTKPSIDYEQMKKTMFTFKLLNLIKKCRGKGKFGLAIKLTDKYKLDKKKLGEAYYD
jgi:mannose/fructose/N-acetylgalactosamine-specific phosphotransferase system component IID